MQAVAVRRRWRIGAGPLLALVIAGAALTVVTGDPAAAVSPVAAANDHTVKGYLSLQDSATFVGKECQGAGGYTDLVEGTPVVVRVRGDAGALAFEIDADGDLGSERRAPHDRVEALGGQVTITVGTNRTTVVGSLPISR